MPGGRHLQRVVEEVVEDLLEPAGGGERMARPADRPPRARGARPRTRPTHRTGRRRPRRATSPPAPTAPARRASASSPSTRRESRSTSASAPSRSSAIGPWTSASRISSRSRSAASGVRSWCDASATNALRLDELLELLPALNDAASTVSSAGLVAPRRAPTGHRHRAAPRLAQVAERAGHRARSSWHEEHDAEHDTTGRGEQQPDRRIRSSTTAGVRDPHRSLDALADPTGPPRRAGRCRGVATSGCRSPGARRGRPRSRTGRRCATAHRGWRDVGVDDGTPVASTITTRPPVPAAYRASWLEPPDAPVRRRAAQRALRADGQRERARAGGRW